MKKRGINDLPKVRFFRKTFLLMKFTFLLVVITSLQLSARAYSQVRTVTLKMENVSFNDVAKEIQYQSGLTFLYNNAYTGEIKDLNLDYTNTRIETVLDKIFAETRLTYEIIDNTVVVKQARPTTQSGNIVKGIVTDEQGNPLPGVTVLLKGTSLGVATDPQGKFSIETVNANEVVLIFTFIGMQKKEMKYNHEKELHVILEENISEMEEVVITGYFNKTKESFTGSQITVGREEMAKVGSLNLLQALNAFDPSIRLVDNLLDGSNPNVVPEINIRGENGFDLRGNIAGSNMNPNAPLYILDGVEVSAERIYDMDMNRIESTTILKDASATALYGSRGANGVIIITTVRPKSGKIKINLNANFNVSIPDLRDYNLMNASEKLEYEKLAGVYKDSDQNEQMKLDLLYNKRLEEVRRGVNTDWLSQPLQRSLNQRYSVNFEGGDQNFRYGIDLRYDTDKGVMKESGREKYGINITFNYNIGTNFFIQNDVIIDNVKGDNSPYNEFVNYTQRNPYERIRDEEGKYIQKLSSGEINPLADVDLPKINSDVYTSFQDNFNIDWRIAQSFRMQGRFSYTKQFNKSELFASPYSASFLDEKDLKKRGSYHISDSKSDRFDGNLTLSYNKSLDKHTLNIGAGSNMMQAEGKGNSFTGVGFINPELAYIGAAAAFKDQSKPGGSYDKSRLVGFFANANYGYDNRYFMDLSYRTDGSSKFGRNSRFAPFWSVGAAWNVNKEHFWTGDFRNSLKIRGSVGSTGTTNFSSSQALTTYIYDFDAEYNGVFGTSQKGYGNPDLKWQSTLSYNAGIDLVFLRGIIAFNGDFYLKKTQNLLLPIDVVSSTGFTSYTENIGELKNTGVEGRLHFTPINRRDKDLRWDVTLAAFHNQNKIQKLSNKLEAINKKALDDTRGTTVYRQYEAGRSQSAIMLVRSGGIDPATGNEVYIKKNGTLTFEYDPNDKVECGDTSPKVEGTANTNLRWKGFNLYLLFRYKWGGKAYNGTLASKVEGANPYKNADRRVLEDRWKEPGDQAKFRRIDDDRPPYQTTRLLFDDNLFALQSVSLSYEMPRTICQRIYAERIKFLLSSTDLFRLSSIKQERGINYPFARTFSMGLNVTF